MAEIITVNGERSQIEKKELTLAKMQEIVGGYIQIVWLADGRGMVLNEEGKMMNLPMNYTATKIFEKVGMPGDYVVGNVIIAKRSELN